MINRFLVPPNASLGAEGAAPPGTRRKTAMDTRTVIAADLPPGQIDALSKIPAYMPMDVLSSRMVIPRDMPIHALDVSRTTPDYVPLDVLGKHVAVPKDAVLPDAVAVRQPLQHAAEMPEVLDPDVLTTGEVHLMTDGPRSLKDEQKWVLRGTSAVLHAAAIAILLLIPSLFTSRQPTQDEIIAASHSLGDLYMPPDLRSALHPTPHISAGNPIHIDPKIIRKLAPPPVSLPQPKAEIPAPAIAQPQPKETTAPPPPLPVAPQPQPVKPQPTLEPIRADQPPTPHGLILPNTSIGHTLSQAANDLPSGGGGGAPSSGASGRMPGGHGGGGGGGGGGGQASAGLTRLTDTQGVDFSAYDARIVASVKRNWYSIMPESALMGDQGIVMLRFRIFKDGSVVAEEPILERSSNKSPLDRAAMGSIRASSPFEPLPSAFNGPFVEYQFIYYYNLEIPRGR
jgi:outer membrane biosynthesis protein TonB